MKWFSNFNQYEHIEDGIERHNVRRYEFDKNIKW
jgi:hypothetical protein